MKMPLLLRVPVPLLLLLLLPMVKVPAIHCRWREVWTSLANSKLRYHFKSRMERQTDNDREEGDRGRNTGILEISVSNRLFLSA